MTDSFVKLSHYNFFLLKGFTSIALQQMLAAWWAASDSICGILRAVILPISPVLVRPRLGCCIQTGAPLYKRDMGRLERGAMKMMKGVDHLASKERLRAGMVSLRRRLSVCV